MKKIGGTVTFEEFSELYDETKGFCSDLYKNSPTYGEGEDFFSFLKKGSELLNKENPELARDILD